MRSFTTSLYLTLGLLILFSCNENDNQKQALGILQEAKELEKIDAFSQAIAKVDSAIALAPIDTTILRQATRLKRHIYLQEANDKLLEIQEKLGELTQQIPSKLKKFDKVENKYYATELNYQHPYLTTLDKRGKSFLRIRLDSLGGIHLASVYVGRKAIKHSLIEIRERGGEQSYRSQPIVYDKALNYRFKIGNKHWEIVSYGVQDSKAMAKFMQKHIAQNKLRSLELHYLEQDKSKHSLHFDKKYAKAIKESLELYQLLYRRDSLRRQEAKFARRFIRLNK